MKMSTLLKAILFLIIILNIGIFAENSAKTITAQRISEAPNIDGSLTEEMWNQLPILTDFVQYNPYNGNPASQKTEVRIGYDDQALYFGAVCYDQSPEKIRKELTIRDQMSPGMTVDLFAVILSPFNDGLNSIFLWVSAAGVQRDVKIHGDQHDITWDAVWESKVRITDYGWIAEIKIPFSALRFSSQSIQNWGLNLWRWIPRYQEWDVWYPVELTYPGWWKKNGSWTGIQNLDPPVRLSFTPYISGYFETNTNQETEFLYNGGIDFKYGISRGFTVDSTLVPDFGQVESDDIELNLSPYEIKYNEKRQFFTEGTELFSKGDLFYSRRIGDRPADYEAVYGEIGKDEIVSSNPQAVRLINATKISGRTNKGLGIGIINAMTANTYADVFNQVTGKERQILTQPFTNYNMVVLDQTLFSHSYISLINSNVSRRDHYANVTAVDFSLADSTNTFGLGGIFGYSWIQSDLHSQSGYKLRLNGGKIGGNFQAKYDLSLISDDYDQNDFGYLQRNNEIINQLSLSHRITRPFSYFLNLQNQINIIYGRTYEPSDFSEFIYNYEISAQFKNHFQLSFRIEHAPMERKDYYEPRAEGRFFINHKYYKYGISGTTDPRKPIWLEIDTDYAQSYDYDFDVSSFTLIISPYLNLGNHINLRLESVYESCQNQPGYVDRDAEAGIIYFGQRDRETTVNTFELTYLFDPKISLNFRLRHYHSKAEYDSFFELQPSGRFQSSSYDKNHNINYNAFNIDCTLRWNFAPGSEILLNWKNAVYTTDQLTHSNYWENLSNTIYEPQINSLSLKVIYYFDI